MNKQTQKLPPLLLCILLDVVGYASFALPVLGEFADMVWAPVSAFIFYKLFGGKMGILGSGINFLEELLPFTDFVPSFSIAWFVRFFALQKRTNSLARI